VILSKELSKNCKTTLNIEKFKNPYYYNSLGVVQLFDGRQCAGLYSENNADTVWGTIKISSFGKISGAYNLSGIETETYYFGVSFKADDETKFTIYYPESLQGFAFQYKSTQYIFNRFTLNLKSIVTSEKQRNRFLCLMYRDNNYQLYRNVLIDPNNGLISVPDKWLRFTVYYLYSESKGIVKVEKSKKYKNLQSLLADYDFDSRFIEQLDKKIDFIDIKDVLKQYNNWLKNN